MKTFFLVLFTVGAMDKPSLGSQKGHKVEPIVEAYWESSYYFPQDKSKCRSGAPNLGPINLLPGIPAETLKPTVLNIAFADYDVDRCARLHFCREIICGLGLYEDRDEQVYHNLTSSIKQAQDEGIAVKLAYGGGQYGNIRAQTRTTQIADRVVSQIVDAVEALGVDGVDLMQTLGCGRRNFRCDDQTSVHLYILESLRNKLAAGKLISYTFPTGNWDSGIDFPFVDVIKYGHQYLDTITLFGLKRTDTVQTVLDLGVPASKLIWGLSIGCDRASVANTKTASVMAGYAKMMQLGGVSVWSINKGVVEVNNNCTSVGVHTDGSYFRAIADGWTQ